jgi:aspartate racemase
MKTIGVLGGLGPQATMDFEARLHRLAQQRIPQHVNTGYPPMVVYYFRQIPVVLPADGSMPTSRPPIEPALLDAARKLGALADFLVITANGIHAYQDEIEQASGRKVVSMVDATLEEVRRRQHKRVGIVDFRPAQVGVYASRLDQLGIPWVGLPPDLMNAMTGVMHAVDEGRVDAEISRRTLTAISYLRSQGPDGIILACTEFPLSLHDELNDPDLINPIQYLADVALKQPIT